MEQLNLAEIFPNRFKDRMAIVTGGASGIGLAVTRRLLLEGARLFIIDRSDKNLSQAVGELDLPCGSATADVSKAKEITQAVETALTYLNGRVDVLVNSAGIYRIKPLLDISLSEWEEVQAVNLRGAFFVSQMAARTMINSGRGAIVNLSSVAGVVGDLGEPCAHYNASKAGIIALTRQLAVELAPHGIRANAVCPGVIDTPMLMMMKRDIEEGKRFLNDRVPLRRLGTAEEVAAVVLFLASDEASYVTGETVAVDGGFLST